MNIMRPLSLLTALAIPLLLSGCDQTPTGSLPQAKTYIQKGDTRNALIELKNVLQAGPDSEASFLLGQIYNENSHFQEAEKELVKARKGGFDLARITPVLARVLLGLGNPERVLEEAGPVTTAPPETNALIYALRARALLILGRRDDALQSLAHADRYQIDHPETLLVRAALIEKPEEAMPFVSKAIETAPKLAAAWHMKGDLLRDSEQNDEAMGAYNKAAELAPNDLATRLSRALLLIKLGQLEAADKDIAVGRKQAPERVHVRYLDALLDFQRRNYQDSVNKLLSIAGTAADFIPARALLGAASMALGQQEQAISNLKYVISKQPDNQVARKLLATAMARGNDINAAQQILSTINLTDDPRMMALAGQIAMNKQDLAQARKHFQEAARAAPNDPGILTQLATSLMASGNDEEAMKALSRAVDLDAKEIGPVVTLVNTLMRSKRYPDALKVADKHVAELPNDATAHNLRGIVLINMGNDAEARKSFTQALTLKPAYLAAARNLARLDLLAKNPQAAKSRINAILSQAPGNSDAWLALADLAAAEKDDAGYLKALESANQANIADLTVDLRLVRYWLNKNQPDRALAVAREANQLDPKREDAIALLGMVHWQRGERKEAMTLFKNWTQLKPDSSAAHYALAHTELASGDGNSSLRSLEKALALRPDFPEALRAKALILADTGRALNALAMARDLQLKLPNSPLGHALEAEVLEHDKKPLDAARKYVKVAEMTGQSSMVSRAAQAFIAGGQPSQAEQLLNRRLASHPQDAVIRRALGQLLIRAGRPKEAATHFETLVKAFPQDIPSLNNLAMIYGEQKHPRAIAVAEQALAAAPQNPAVMDTAGWVLVNQGEVKRGLDLLRQAAAKLPDNPELQWHLANAYAKAGEKASARLELERLISGGRSFPQQAEVKKLLDSLR